MNIRRRLKAHTEIHTGPLNDILFILLLFFLIAATLANPNLLPVSLPKAKSEANKSKQSVVVSIDANDQYYVGNNKVDLARLKEQLLPIIQKDTANAMIVINMDSSVSIAKGFYVVRIAQELGVKSSFSVKRN